MARAMKKPLEQVRREHARHPSPELALVIWYRDKHARAVEDAIINGSMPLYRPKGLLAWVVTRRGLAGAVRDAPGGMAMAAGARRIYQGAGEGNDGRATGTLHPPQIECRRPKLGNDRHHSKR